jgi:Fic family protein
MMGRMTMNIPYTPKFNRSALLVRHLAKASELGAWFRQQTLDVSWVPKIQRDALIRLAHYSTRIEGNPLTLPEVEALSAGKDLPVEQRAKREVLNYFSGLRWIWKSGARKIQEKSLLHLHQILTNGLLPGDEVGKYKIKQNAVFGRGKMIYKPPPPEAAGILTRGLLKWINSGKAEEEHPILAASIAHHRLVSIHPFMDGNGRISRAVESWILYRRGFDTHHIFALDEFFDHDRERYYREIQKVRDEENDLTSWIEYVSEGILETLKKTQQKIQRIRINKPSVKIPLNKKQERVLEILAESPKCGGKELATALGLSRSGLSFILKPLLKVGLIGKEGSTKAAFYKLR